MWRSIVTGGSSLPKLRSVLNPSPAHYRTLTLISPSTLPQSPSHFSPFHPNPKFFCQVSTDPSDHQSPVPDESCSEAPILDTRDILSTDTITGSDDNPSFDLAASEHSSLSFDSLENGGQQIRGIAWSDEKHVTEIGAVNGFDENQAAFEHSSVTCDNLENGPDLNEGVVWSDEKHEIEIEIDTEKLESVLSLLQSSVDEPLGSSLEEMGLALHEEFVLRILETPLVPGRNLLQFFEWASKQPDFLITTQMVGGLVRAISNDLKRLDVYSLWDMMKEIGERESGVLTTEILNKVIALLSKLGKGKAAFEVFNKFGEFGCVPNVETYLFTIEALCRRSFYDWAWSVCEEMLNVGSLPRVEETGKIISWLCKGNKPKEAHVVYSLAKEKNQPLPRHSVNFLISSLSRVEDSVHLAVEMLEDFPSEVRRYAIKPFSSVIRGLCRIKDVEGAKTLVGQMIDAGPPPGNAVFNSVINSLSKAGDLEQAMTMMKLMESRGLKPDVYTYTVLMSGYASGGQMEEACRVLAEAKKKHSKLSPVTYHIIIRGFCKLEEFDQALKFLDEMKSYGVHPNADEYGKLIQSLCLKALDWKTAEKLLEEMKGNGLYLNGITRGLIRAVKELDEEGIEAGELSFQA